VANVTDYMSDGCFAPAFSPLVEDNKRRAKQWAYSVAIGTRPASGDTIAMPSGSRLRRAAHSAGTAVKSPTGARKNPCICSVCKSNVTR
ncbi:MAG TPA: hypothetical protein VF353_07545, partial [Candidatus Binatia bacterium]